MAACSSSKPSGRKYLLTAKTLFRKLVVCCTDRETSSSNNNSENAGRDREPIGTPFKINVNAKTRQSKMNGMKITCILRIRVDFTNAQKKS